jgi:hypothetical protein
MPWHLDSKMLARWRGSVWPINFLVNHAGHLVIRAPAISSTGQPWAELKFTPNGTNKCQEPQPQG